MFDLILVITVFVLSYFVIVTDIFPPSVAAILGSTILIVFGVVSSEEAIFMIDFEVILLLLGMMAIVNIILETGIFEYIAIKIAKLVRGRPLPLLIFLCLITAFLSAFLDNVTTLLVLAPVTIILAKQLGINPIPFVICEAIASNIGGASTLIGDPPNVLIASYSNYTFNDFIIHLGPIAIVNIAIFVFLSRIIFGKMHVPRYRRALIMELDACKAINHNRPFKRHISVFGLVILGFLLSNRLDISPSFIAVFGASIMVILNRKSPDKIFSEMEWNTVFFFIGLFIIVGSVNKVGVLDWIAGKILILTGANIFNTSILILWVSNIASAFLDNIPFTATMAPMIKSSIIPAVVNLHPHISATTIGHAIWWSLSLGTCLGGNGTLVGSSANVVAANIANKSGYKLTFWEFTKYGMIFSISTTISSSIYIYIRYLMAN